MIGQRLFHYEIVEKLGEGRMRAVYTTEPGEYPAGSQDRTALYCSSTDRRRIFRMPLGGGRPEQVLEKIPESRILRFPKEPGAYYRSDYRALSIRPDARWIIWDQLDRIESDIRLVENFR